MEPTAAGVRQWAEDMHTFDDSKTVEEWIAWLREQLFGEREPLVEMG